MVLYFPLLLVRFIFFVCFRCILVCTLPQKLHAYDILTQQPVSIIIILLILVLYQSNLKNTYPI